MLAAWSHMMGTKQAALQGCYMTFCRELWRLLKSNLVGMGMGAALTIFLFKTSKYGFVFLLQEDKIPKMNLTQDADGHDIPMDGHVIGMSAPGKQSRKY